MGLIEDALGTMAAGASTDIGALLAAVGGIAGGALFAIFGGNIRNLLGDGVYNIVVFSVFVWAMLSTSWLFNLLGFTLWGVPAAHFPYALIIIGILYEFRNTLF